METITFKVKPDTALHRNYFEQKGEEAFFKKLANEFLRENIPETTSFMLSGRLTVGMPEDCVKKFNGQLMKGIEYSKGHPIYRFKRKSELGKLWQKQVYARINEKAMDANFWWLRDFYDSGTFSGAYAMWDDKEGNVYGLVESKNEWTHLVVPDTVERITMSEYYAIAERVYPEQVSNC